VKKKMQYLKYQLYQRKRNQCELKVSDWGVTLSLKKGTLSFRRGRDYVGYLRLSKGGNLFCKVIFSGLLAKGII